MGSGGARVRSGPPPDPNALRRDRSDDAEWASVPDVPRTEPAPKWPLTECSKREGELWRRLWTKPQATMWERYGVEIEVAIYVRRLAEYEQPLASASLGSLVARSADALGLTIPGMRANRWRLVDVGAARGTDPAEQPKRAARRSNGQSLRNQFSVIDGDGA